MKGSTVAVKTMVGGCLQFLGTPEDLWELKGQFLMFGEMVKLTGKGETHQ